MGEQVSMVELGACCRGAWARMSSVNCKLQAAGLGCGDSVATRCWRCWLARRWLGPRHLCCRAVVSEKIELVGTDRESGAKP